MTSKAGPGLLALLPLYFAVAFAMGFVDQRVRTYPDHAFTEYVPTITAGTAEAPGRYRVLAPYAYVGLSRATGLSAADAWLLFRGLCLVLALVVGHVYFRTWGADATAMAGNLLVMGLLPLTFTNSWAHPDHLMELWLFTLACLCIARGWPAAFLVVLAVNALNRETSAFLLPLFLLSRPITRGHLRWVAAAGVVWLSIFVGLRWQLGWVTYSPWHAAENLRLLLWWPLERDVYYRLYSWFFVILTVPLWWIVGRTLNRQTRFTRMAALVVAPLFLVVGLTFSSVIEPRIFTPLLVLLVPGVLLGLAADSSAPNRLDRLV